MALGDKRPSKVTLKPPAYKRNPWPSAEAYVKNPSRPVSSTEATPRAQLEARALIEGRRIPGTTGTSEFDRETSRDYQSRIAQIRRENPERIPRPVRRTSEPGGSQTQGGSPSTKPAMMSKRSNGSFSTMGTQLYSKMGK